MNWISAKESEPEVGEFVGVFRIEYPSFCWIGIHDKPFSEREDEDIPDYWIKLPKLEGYQ